MKKIVKIGLIVSVILLIALVVTIAIANTEGYAGDTVYAADIVSEQPNKWYDIEQEGWKIIGDPPADATWIQISVPFENEPNDLVGSFVKYNGKFFCVNGWHVTPGLPESVKQFQAPIGFGFLGSCFATVFFHVKGRR